MSDKLKRYTSDDIDVTYSTRRCIHAAECVRRLPAVFDTSKRPWVQPDQAPADAVAEAVSHCPTGALHVERKDGGEAEAAPERNTVRLAADGPLYVRGSVRVVTPDGESVVEETRLALCRCGASANKPFCDNSHKEIAFEAPPDIREPDPEAAAGSAGALTVTLSDNGPLLLRGDFELLDAAGRTRFRGEKAALCRCGHSGNKPFCDGSHKSAGFDSAQ